MKERKINIELIFLIIFVSLFVTTKKENYNLKNEIDSYQQTIIMQQEHISAGGKLLHEQQEELLMFGTAYKDLYEKCILKDNKEG